MCPCRQSGPAGRVLFGTEFWEHPPAPAQLASMWPGISANDCTSLAEVADQAVAAGFRPLRIETATQANGKSSNPGWPPTLRSGTRLDKQRSIWLRGHRGVMGFAYLTLGRANESPA